MLGIYEIIGSFKKAELDLELYNRGRENRRQ